MVRTDDCFEPTLWQGIVQLAQGNWGGGCFGLRLNQPRERGGETCCEPDSAAIRAASWAAEHPAGQPAAQADINAAG